ncbi:Na+/H+ antiporter NhaC [Natroniella acetigena]|uniref:Na+/H+ antiporter NhaC n=1 Tax=Natroniella acetigena TaxID=52004 RepID=UPI00200AD857|nr:Na+/H+ antiporter NhaC [Natroniella acetigena]MCK8828354.1 Na+/H+ antiporter NhaC [Natroniella acetigena]
MNQKKSLSEREPSFLEAIVGLFLVVFVIIGAIRTELVLPSALVFGAITAALFALYLGYSWEKIQSGMIEGIQNGMIACLILIAIGMVIGVWILGGTVQTLIYLGLNLLTPQIYLPVTFLLCGITSVFIGSSLGTIATMGLVLIGVAQGLGVPLGMAAGAITSGAMFGDKLSPLSDSTNLTSAISGAKLFDHIRSMLLVTVPAAIICLIIYTLLGTVEVVGTTDWQSIEMILTTLESNFNLSLLTLVPPVFVIILSYLKVPALITLMISFFLGAIFAVITQGADLNSILVVSTEGFVSETGVEIVDDLLTHGGIEMMMSTVAMIIASTAMGGILEKIGVLKAILDKLLEHVKTPRGLVLSVLAASYLMLLASGEMMVSIIVPGRTFKPAFEKMNVNLAVLSRTLESAATLGCAALPWGVVAIYLQGILGVGLEFVPYTFISFLVPIIVIIYAFADIGMWRTDINSNIDLQSQSIN